MFVRVRTLLALVTLALFLAGCPKGGTDFKAGKRAELEKDYDTALIQYERALKQDPGNAQYQLRAQRARFAAATYHVEQGRNLRNAGQLEAAAAEFERAAAIDPSSFLAEQELRRTLAMIAEQRRQQQPTPPQAPAPKELQGALEAPPELAPLSRAPINYRATADSKQVYETIGKLAGITVIFDPDYQSRRVSVEFTDVTLEQALDMVALQTKTFWKPVTSNTIMVIPDTAAKRKDYEEQVIRTFYLSNISSPQELTEIVTALRNLLDLNRIQPSTSQNAILIRATPSKLAVAEKIIRDIDKAKPEVVIQVAVLQARRDRARELGIVPGTSATLLFSPRNPVTQPSTGTTGTTTPGTTTTTTGPGAIRLSNLGRLSSADYSVVLPGAQAMALLTDATTKILQNPEVRATDGQTAKLRIGDKVPIATGSFQPGIGGVGINPLVNTQFQYTDVGVNLDITPRVNTNREISMKITVEVSSVTQRVNIGGIDQPVIGQRRVEHDIRLKEGESSILGGIIERTETLNTQGWPGLGQIPLLRYFFSSERKEIQENEILIVLTPRIVRLPEITMANLRSLSVGTDQNIQVRSVPSAVAPTAPPAVAPPAAPGPEAVKPEKPAPEKKAPETTPALSAIRLRFEPVQARLAPGATVALNVQADEVRDAFAVTFLVQFDPAVIEIQDVQHGGLLSSDGQAVAIVHRVDEQTGSAIFSLTRPPDTGGVSGSGALVTLVLKGKGKGRTMLRIAQATMRDAKQAPMPVVIGQEAILTVE